MKRLLCMILTGLMLFSAACTAAPAVQVPEVPTDVPETQPTDVPADEPAEAPTDEPEAPITIQPIEDPPIDLTDPILPIDEPTGETADVGGYADFSSLLSATLLDGRRNRNLSPISVWLAMAMVAEGANGETQAELLKLLGCKTIEDLRTACAAMLKTLSVEDEGCVLDVHNSLWMAEAIGGMPVHFHEDFLSVLGDTYRSEANTVDFSNFTAGQQIAEWITEQTRGKIEVDPQAMRFDPMTIAVLINTIYLKSGWTDPFDTLLTEQGVFYGTDPETGDQTEITVDYMHRSDRNVTITQGDGWLRYRVYLNTVGYISFVLPDEGISLDRLLGSPEAIDKLLHKGIDKTCNVSLQIPKFSFQDKMELTAILQSLGLAHCFDDDADFSRMSDPNCRIDSVLQQSYIGVDENGVEAAAYTMVSMRATGYFNPVELETIEFHLTRPFFYSIETYDGDVLFIGTVTTPNAAENVHK